MNISAVDVYTADPDLATDDLVGPPTPRCTFVNSDGSVKLSWVPAVDTVNNFAKYNIQYRTYASTLAGGPWLNIPGDADDLLDISDFTFPITGINAQIEQYDFRITSLAGCNGDSAMFYNEISSIFLSASPKQNVPQAISELSWNPAGPDYSGLGNFFDLYGAKNLDTLAVIGASQFVQNDEDIVQLDACRLPVRYRLNYTDDLFQAVGLTCEVQSNVAAAVHLDTIPPEPEDLTMLSFNRTTNELVAWWVGNALGADSVSFFTRDGFNSGLPIVRSLTDGAVDINRGGGSPHSYAFELARIDATDSVRVAGALAKDKCDNVTRGSIVYHKSMDVDVEWKICDSTNIVSWTEYVGLNPDFAVEYEVFYSTDGGANWGPTLNSVTTDSTYDHLITQGGLTYSYYVRATSLDPNTPTWATPESNVASTLSIYEDTPLYYYLTNATVLPSNDVEVEYYRDIITPVKGYTVFRGENPDEMLPKAYFDAKDLGVEDENILLDDFGG